MPRTFKVIPLTTLKALNSLAIKRDANMTLEPRVLDKYPDGTQFPVVQAFFHNDGDMRVIIAIDDDDNTAMLDMPVGSYNKLPIFYPSDLPKQTLAEELDEAFGG